MRGGGGREERGDEGREEGRGDEGREEGGREDGGREKERVERGRGKSVGPLCPPDYSLFVMFAGVMVLIRLCLLVGAALKE